MSKFFYVIAGIVTFLAFILVMAPASLLVAAVEDQLKAVPDLKVGHISGRVWSGSAQIQYQQFPTTVTWDLSALSLLVGRLSADVELREQGLDASFHLSVSGNEGTIRDAKAVVDARYINRISVGYGLDLSGQFNLSEANVSFANQWITTAVGNLDWPGGIVHIETPQQLYSVDLPPLNGDLFMHEDNLRLAVQGSGERMLDLTLKRTGWVAAAVSYAFMDLAGLPLPGSVSASPEEPAVLLEEKIL
ncbi:MAG: type II secretion system protein N [Pseudomonadales bacterium]|nr:type II secretion system protein N [Pseudomonadales bacterium]MBO6596286.1 type II secretion system protein N [Pseudomonadales bacterium]MBO6822766.1 type II secretion system protein N [Pseudomonadales bacterium]